MFEPMESKLIEMQQKVENALDAQLRDCSRGLFRLDADAFRILGCIAKNGPLTIYEMQKNHGIPKGKVTRRLRPVDNLSRDFLREEGRTPFRIKGHEKIYLGLTLKGFLASLSEVNGNDNYLFRIYVDSAYRYLRTSPSRKFTDNDAAKVFYAIRMRRKIFLWCFFSYHINQGLELTFVKSMVAYFTSWWNQMNVFTWEQLGELELINSIRKIAVFLDEQINNPKVIEEDPIPLFIETFISHKNLKDWGIKENASLNNILSAYEGVIRQLRNLPKPKNLPWDHALLLTGKRRQT